MYVSMFHNRGYDAPTSAHQRRSCMCGYTWDVTRTPLSLLSNLAGEDGLVTMDLEQHKGGTTVADKSKSAGSVKVWRGGGARS